MKLNEKIVKQLTEAISVAVEQGTPFPLEIASGRKIKHRIVKEKSDSGYFITTIDHDGKTYLIYLI